MTDADFAFLQSFMLRRSGAALWTEKRYFVQVRLAPLAAREGLADVPALVAAVRREPDGERATRVVEALQTTETLFFRDQRPFEQLEKVILPRLAAARQERKVLRIWCAACASGQEAYSIAIICARLQQPLAGLRVEIRATDISREQIEKARSGRYTHFEAQRGLSIQCLLDHFRQDGDTWVITPALRGAVEFRVHNLLHDAPGFGQFDVVLLRNALIHLDMTVRAEILARMARHLAPDGVLLLGAAESALGLGNAIVPHPTERGAYARSAYSSVGAAGPSLSSVGA